MDNKKIGCDEEFERFLNGIDFEKIHSAKLFEEDFGKDCYLDAEKRQDHFSGSLLRAFEAVIFHLAAENRGIQDRRNLNTFLKNCLFLAYQGFACVKLKYYKSSGKLSFIMLSDAITLDKNDLLLLKKICEMADKIEILPLFSDNFKYEMTVDFCLI